MTATIQDQAVDWASMPGYVQVSKHSFSLAPEVDYEHIALNVRRSPGEPDTDSVEGQLSNGFDFIPRVPELAGLPVVVYCDSNISGYKEDVTRPGYDALKLSVTRGLVRYVVSRNQARITRSDWRSFYKLATAFGVAASYRYQGGVVEFGRARDKLVSGMEGLMDEHYGDQVTEDVLEKHEKRRKAGLPATGHAPFGYCWAGVKPYRTFVQVPEEVALIHRIVDLLFRGWSCSAVAKLLDSEGLTGRKGGQWTSSNLKRMLSSPVQRGFHLDVPNGKGRNVPSGRKGDWEPIFDEATAARLDAILNSTHVQRADGTVMSRAQTEPRSHLLTNIVVCGRCHLPLKGKTHKSRGGSLSYECPTGRGGCGLGISHGEAVDEAVVAEVLGMYRDPTVLRLLAGDRYSAERQALQRELDEVTASREEWLEKAESGPPSQMLMDLMQRLEDRTVALTARVRALPPPAKQSFARVPEDWGAMTVEEQRAAIRRVMDRVVILAVGKGGARRNLLDRVKPVPHPHLAPETGESKLDIYDWLRGDL